MKTLLVILTVFLLTACDGQKEPVYDAKYLVLHECKFSGYAFDSLVKTIIPYGRAGFITKETLNTYYLYVCADSSRIVSTVKVKLEKVD